MNHKIRLTLLVALSAMTAAASLHAQNHRSFGQPDPEQQASRLVVRFDKDGSGELSPEELGNGLAALREGRGAARGRSELKRSLSPDERAGRWLQRWDINQDGKLDADELSAAMASHPSGHTRGGRP